MQNTAREWALTTAAKRHGRKYFVNYNLSVQAVHKLQLQDFYHNATIIDAYPGNAVWSAALYNTIKPARHIMMEPQPGFRKFLDPLQPSTPGLHVVSADPFRWRSFTELVSEGLFAPQLHDRTKGIHPNILFTANLTMAQGEQLCTQYLNCITNQSWLQSYGRVRLLLWVRASTAAKLLLPVGDKNRSRVTMHTESATKAQVVVGCAEMGANGLKNQAVPCQPLVMSTDARADYNFHGSTADLPVLLQLDPLQDQPKYLDSFEYCLRMLFISRSKPIADGLPTLGAGALEHLGPKLDPAILQTRARDLTLAQFEQIVEVFEHWPFKPDMLHDFFDDDNMNTISEVR